MEKERTGRGGSKVGVWRLDEQVVVVGGGNGSVWEVEVDGGEVRGLSWSVDGEFERDMVVCGFIEVVF